MSIPAKIQSMIVSGAWIQIYVNGHPQPNIALGAAMWLDGRGLLFAELGAEHQGHIHLLESRRLEMDGETIVDAYDSRGELAATIHPMTATDSTGAGVVPWVARIHGQTSAGDAWRRFWAAQIRNVTEARD